MHVLVYLLEAVFLVEFSSYGVVLEHIELDDAVKTPGVVHQRTPESPAMILRVDENPPHLISDQRNETHHDSIVLVNPRFGLGEMDFLDGFPLPLEECLVEERMGQQ